MFTRKAPSKPIVYFDFFIDFFMDFFVDFLAGAAFLAEAFCGC